MKKIVDVSNPIEAIILCAIQLALPVSVTRNRSTCPIPGGRYLVPTPLDR